ncbi:hypothetical protein C8Q80DRAFT_287537 [Daedaleopsis nitida]|nr:hypothetical protein C8Q80DRAFT_287537 [Daedaleopsis nitida]
MSRSTLGPPEWLETHPEITRRNIVLEAPLKPFCVWRTNFHLPTVQYAVKVIPPDGQQEVDIYEMLHKLYPASPNHTLPCDIIRPHRGTVGTEEPFLIMPCLDKLPIMEHRTLTTRRFLNICQQVVEGIEFLHRLHITHMDMYDGQVLMTTERDLADHKELEADKVYIIDFGTSLRLQYGPGRQPAVDLPETC